MLHAYATFLAETGTRCESETLWPRWEEGDFIWIASGRDGHRTKTEEDRWVQKTATLRARMREPGWAPSVTPSTRPWSGPSSRTGSGPTISGTAGSPPGWLTGATVVKVKEAVGHSALATTMG